MKLLDPAVFEESEMTPPEKLIAYRLKTEKAERLRVVPLQGNRRSSYRRAAIDLARLSERFLWEYQGDPALLANEDYLNMLATLCWLKDRDLFIPYETRDNAEKHRERNEGLPLVSVPLTLFLPISERRQINHIDPNLLLPVVAIPPLGFEQRLNIWKEEFAADADEADDGLKEIARRFRYEKETIRQICAELKALPEKPSHDDFIAACRAELSFDIGELAGYVEPRFAEERLILPHKQDAPVRRTTDGDGLVDKSSLRLGNGAGVERGRHHGAFCRPARNRKNDGGRDNGAPT